MIYLLKNQSSAGRPQAYAALVVHPSKKIMACSVPPLRFLDVETDDTRICASKQIVKIAVEILWDAESGRFSLRLLRIFFMLFAFKLSGSPWISRRRKELPIG